MPTIDDLCPAQPAPLPPRLSDDGRILTVHDSGGRMVRLALTPAQLGILAGDIVRILSARSQMPSDHAR